ncbi:MAG: LytTR family transcriptional regulator [Gemmatimonadetes bacterium]|nr:LytTR family transcriptional regulator [Gemmatimonadota bacterium]
MVPNKIVIAATGALAAAGIRQVLLRTWDADRTPWRHLLIALVASAVLGLAWDLVLSTVLGHRIALDLGPWGALRAGVPRLTGAFYHASILAIWSLSYLAMWREPGGAPEPEAVADMTQRPDEHAHASGGVAEVAAPTRLVLRDGRRVVMLGLDEIDWVEAEGDYVRVHAGSRRLLLRATLAGTASTLPAHRYVRIHRSTIVRVALVRELVPRPNREYDVVLRGGVRLRASRRYAEQLCLALGVGAGCAPQVSTDVERTGPEVSGSGAAVPDSGS